MKSLIVTLIILTSISLFATPKNDTSMKKQQMNKKMDMQKMQKNCKMHKMMMR